MTELAVLVPVLARPQNVAPLVQSFLAGCPEDSRLCFLSAADDEAEHGAIIDALCVAGEQGYEQRIVNFLCLANDRTWPQRINAGVQSINADWYLCAADDITFEAGWWDATLLARNQGYGVIGTNDAHPGEKGNPAVAAGCHTCHPLISRAYIDEFGTVDESGKVAYEGYSHWYVDNEIVRTAMARKQWIYVREAVIRHLHPYWRGTDNVPWDDTYTAGEANSHADQLVWESRIHLIEAEEERCRAL